MFIFAQHSALGAGIVIARVKGVKTARSEIAIAINIRSRNATCITSQITLFSLLSQSPL